jgi:hypothetical protein
MLFNVLYIKIILYTENDEPQPQVLAAFGLLKVKPRAFNPSWKSICIPARYKP